MGPRKHVLGGVPTGTPCLMNATETCMYDGDAAFLSNYFDHLFLFGIDWKVMSTSGGLSQTAVSIVFDFVGKSRLMVHESVMNLDVC